MDARGAGEGQVTESTGEKSGRIVRVLAEMAMVVFAVLVALAVEEWREEKQMVDFADRARTSVEAELTANLTELRDTRPGLLHVDSTLAAVLVARDLSVLDGDIDVELPNLSDAAWEVAQGSQAAPYFDFDWVLDTARAYEVLEVYTDASDNVIAAMSGLIGREPTVEHIAEIYGWLVIVNDLHRQAIDRLESVLEDSAPGG
jgi:hypothetical protein